MAQATAPPEGKRNRRSVGQIARLALSYAALLFLTLIFVAPLLWMLSTSFKTNVEATTLPLNFLPNEPSTYGYDTILNSAGTPVLRWFVNSMVAAAAHAVLVLATAAPAAYALARMEFRGKRIFFAAIIGTLFIPQFLFLVPNYAIVDTFGWLDTLLAIIVPGAAGAFGVFFLRQFFLALPEELEEAALLDGANRFQIFTRIVLPLSKPALATLALLSFLTNYNDFLWPIYVLFNPESLTLPPGLALLGFSYQTDYAVIMAGGVIASIPVLIVFLIAQRYVIEGIARSGIKG
ncbi:MAG: carbohydrate ABC transporter permease [Actinomycetota bacterium]|jgi:multiple sugar transport system permease protein|nr:carbohydrate ABC transporter permease [Actinomycetota bacterium]MDQ3861380.1 carbohydrate ABC transporter permease [Actinomycetota bacterium]MDQ3892226.1 carbohydrate ABC transporter permease [Actinomycetota bacterium]MDQ5813153.1 carbohydrate ABC transporter permease [Actinomycetota bacterium]